MSVLERDIDTLPPWVPSINDATLASDAIRMPMISIAPSPFLTPASAWHHVARYGVRVHASTQEILRLDLYLYEATIMAHLREINC